jgi:hypothetical protein
LPGDGPDAHVPLAAIGFVAALADALGGGADAFGDSLGRGVLGQDRELDPLEAVLAQ